MRDIKVSIYTKSDYIEDPDDSLFFHSRRLMRIYESTPRHAPYMVVASEEGRVMACMLAVVRWRASWLPPYFYRQCRIYGEGSYRCEEREYVFGLMLSALRERVGNSVFFMEISNLSQKMFGYGQLRRNGFFPVRWMSIHNSLHSKKAEERLSAKMLRRISLARERGITVEEVKDDKGLDDFINLLRSHNQMKIKRFIPKPQFFREIIKEECCHMLLARYRGKAIGCCATIYSMGNAYLWYTAFKRKSYITLHPAETTVFEALKRAEKDGCRHMLFLDVGLPYRKNPFREFIMRFGGKPVSTFRWFSIRPKWLGRILSWMFRG